MYKRQIQLSLCHPCLRADGVSITSSRQEKRLALNGVAYTYDEFKAHYGDRLLDEKWRQATKIQASDTTATQKQETREPNDCEPAAGASMEDYPMAEAKNTSENDRVKFPPGCPIEKHEGSEFEIKIQKQPGKTFGCDVAWDPHKRNFAIFSIHSEGLLPEWNRDGNRLEVRVNDRVVRVNGLDGEEGASELIMIAEIQFADKLDMLIFLSLIHI